MGQTFPKNQKQNVALVQLKTMKYLLKQKLSLIEIYGILRLSKGARGIRTKDFQDGEDSFKEKGTNLMQLNVRHGIRYKTIRENS